MSSEVFATTTALPIAGVFRRLAALIYDTFLLFGLLVAPLIVLIALRSRPTLPDGSVTHDLPPIAPPAVMLLYMVTVVCGFYWYFWRKNGQTLGMQAWRLRLDSTSGANLSLRQCIIRSAVALLSLLVGGLGYYWLWWDCAHLTWHDRASNTCVVLLPKRHS
jgi:uncharacterized RDD family membrane protein YckC